MNDVVLLAARGVQASDATDLATPLSGFGIPSDLCCVAGRFAGGRSIVVWPARDDRGHMCACA
eukprot:2135473-Lingulodinium_polyedra.AAC.1